MSGYNNKCILGVAWLSEKQRLIYSDCLQVPGFELRLLDKLFIHLHQPWVNPTVGKPS